MLMFPRFTSRIAPQTESERGERRAAAGEGRACSGLEEEEEGGRPFEDPHYLNVAKNPIHPPSLAAEAVAKAEGGIVCIFARTPPG